MPNIEYLERPVYSTAQVDALLGLSSGTARRWIDGYERGGKQYLPVIREATTGDDFVTWGEFVETKLLSAYRGAGVRVLHMRPAVEKLRERFGVKYPLATVKPFVSGRDLVYSVQDEVGLDKALRLVVARSDQLLLQMEYDLAPAYKRFIEGVDWEDDLILRLRPLGRQSPVMIDPLRQFGAPVVRSVPTEIIAEQVRAGDPEELIAELYELQLADVQAAIRYELVRQAA